MHRFGTTLSYVDFDDRTKYDAGYGGYLDNDERDELYVKLRNSDELILVRSRLAGTPLLIPITIKGTSATNVRANAAAITTQLANARAFRLNGTGSQVTYRWQFGDMASAQSWNVESGRLEITRTQLGKPWRLTGVLRLQANPS